jgi:hypothetical protein
VRILFFLLLLVWGEVKQLMAVLAVAVVLVLLVLLDKVMLAEHLVIQVLMEQQVVVAVRAQ